MPQSGDKLKFDDALQVDVLFADELADDNNDASIVLKLTYDYSYMAQIRVAHKSFWRQSRQNWQYLAMVRIINMSIHIRGSEQFG